jgi:hypothetical protein
LAVQARGREEWRVEGGEWRREGGNYESIKAERENLLRDLQTRLNEMSETYRRQSALSAVSSGC